MSAAAGTSHADTLVIGAGISGLAFAHALGPTADVRVLERAGLAGGWLATRTVDEAPGARFELGAEALTTKPALLGELCAELDVPTVTAPEATSRRFLVIRGKLVAIPLSPMALLSSGLLSASGKLRALSERVRKPGTSLDGSIAEFARQRFGREVLETFVDPFVSGVHAGDPEQLSLRATFPMVAELVEEHGSVLAGLAKKRGGGEGGPPGSLFKPRGGMRRLAEGLARSLGQRLSLGVTVRAIRRVEGHFEIATDAATLTAERVVLAVDGPSAAELLRELAPKASRELETMTFESLVAVVHGWKREQVEHALDGFGFLAPSREGLATLGTLFSSTIDPECAPPGQVVLRSLLGGARRPELVEASDAELLDRTLKENRPLLGLRGEPAWTRVVRYRRALPRYDLDHPRRVTAIEASLDEVPQFAMLGNSLRTLGVHALAKRAIELGKRAAG